MAILSDFDYGLSLHDTQHFALGQEVVDAQGNRWGYGRIREASGGAHRLMRSTEHTDIMSAGSGVVAAAQAVGSKRLTVATTTNRDFTASVAGNLVGALGSITNGAGIGQQFAIVRVISSTEVEVEVFGSDTGGWLTALATSSRFHLWFPGEVRQGDGIQDFIEGVLHTAAVTADIGKFCYLQRSGRGLIRVDYDGNALGEANLMYPAAAGMVVGPTSPGTVNAASVQAAAREGAASIGRVIWGIGGSANNPVLASLNIPPTGVSRALARTNNSYNRVTIGSN